MGENILEVMKMIKNMDLESSFGLMEEIIKDSGLKENKKGG